MHSTYRQFLMALIVVFLLAIGNRDFFLSVIDEWRASRQLEAQRLVNVMEDKKFERQRITYSVERKALINSSPYFATKRITRFNFIVNKASKRTIEDGNISEQASESQ